MWGAIMPGRSPQRPPPAALTGGGVARLTLSPRLGKHAFLPATDHYILCFGADNVA